MLERHDCNTLRLGAALLVAKVVALGTLLGVKNGTALLCDYREA